MPEYYLHIGSPKTGSTALQEFLETNRDALDRQGVVYPRSTLRGHGHHDLAFHIHGAYPEWATPRDTPLDTIAQELRNELGQTSSRPNCKVVLSSENFYLLCDAKKTSSFLRELGIPYESLTVICYVRRQDDMHASWYNQRVKAQGYSGSLEDSVADTMDLWDYTTRLDRWAAEFGGTRLVVRPYQERDIPSLDIRRDFLHIIGVEENGLTFAQEDSNSGLNQDILEFQRRINELPLNVSEKRRYHKALIALSAATKSRGIFCTDDLLSRNRREEILSTYAASNRRLAERFLGRECLFDDGLSPAMKNAHPPGLDVDKLMAIIEFLLFKTIRQ